MKKDEMNKTEIGWLIHNLIGHPLSEIFYWLGKIYKPFNKLSNIIHDWTVPDHESGNGRG